ncbi:DUF1648 domain-containing protein [Pedosphaera parvula]|uniref:DUF1648 domain-containing protein n=1 Tax=Pedosphaera parvula (strain Ellin514) TaxID=320771 RepID=B9XN16_PEDPL|nr:DUF1648 domain-containing protein [Pedosphaera parvula]EEF58812.1 protein of unknown function DUF1648 [Pedosphaera parvula Ellin514]
MKARVPAILLLLAYVSFLICLFATESKLPLQVATHFNGGGRPDGWMTRLMFLKFMGIFGFMFPLLIVGINFLIRFLPQSSFNMPNRGYWMAPERRPQTFRFFLDHSLWLALFAAMFVAFIYLLVLQANLSMPPKLSLLPLLLSMAAFLLGLLWWGVTLMQHFRKVV